MDRCVLLMQLGGASTPREVFKFTYSLLSDPEILRMPALPRKILAFLISAIRNPVIRRRYGRINGSPIMDITNAQAEKVSELLKSQGQDIHVFYAARHSSPKIKILVNQIKNYKHCLVFPLFPHYSFTTVKTCIDDAVSSLKSLNSLNLSFIDRFFDYPGYINAQTELIMEYLNKYPNMQTLIFSAHSLPKAHIAAGDPYPNEINKSVELISAKLPSGLKIFIGYQSRMSSKSWIGPSTVDLIKEAANSGIKKIMIVPIAFVSEHFETLYELDIEYADLADSLGIKEFVRVPALNTHPLFIKALSELITNSF